MEVTSVPERGGGERKRRGQRRRLTTQRSRWLGNKGPRCQGARVPLEGCDELLVELRSGAPGAAHGSWLAWKQQGTAGDGKGANSCCRTAAAQQR